MQTGEGTRPRGSPCWLWIASAHSCLKVINGLILCVRTSVKCWKEMLCLLGVILIPAHLDSSLSSSEGEKTPAFLYARGKRTATRDMETSFAPNLTGFHTFCHKIVVSRNIQKQIRSNDSFLNLFTRFLIYHSLICSVVYFFVIHPHSLM